MTVIERHVIMFKDEGIYIAHATIGYVRLYDVRV